MVSQGGTRKPASFSLVTSFARHHSNHLDRHHLDNQHHIDKVEHVFIISPIITVIATALKDPNSQDFFIWRKSLDEFGKMVVVMIMRGVVVQALRKLVM